MPRTASLICAQCKGPRTPSGKRLICAPCNRNRVLIHQKTHPEKVNARHRAWSQQIISEGWTRAQANKLWERYGITVAEYEERRISQQGRCAICQQTASPLVVDHDHGNGRLRALLCKGCNFGLGAFGEDITRIRAAAGYLKRYT